MEDPLKKYLQARSAGAFSATVRAYQDHVLNAAFHVLKDVSAAEDVTQTVFLKLLRQPPRAGSVQHERAFLVKCALRAALDWQRTETRRKRRERSVARTERDERAQRMAGVETRFEEIREAVAKLPDELQTPIYLHFFHNFRIDETAEALGCHRNTASRRLEHARTSLRRLLGASATAVLLAPVAARGDVFELTASPRLNEHLAELVAQAGTMAGTASAAAGTTGAVGATGPTVKWLGAAVATLLVGWSVFSFWPHQETASTPPLLAINDTAPAVRPPEAPAESTTEAEPTTTVERRLAPPALRGRVVERDSGQPVVGCRVRVWSWPALSADPFTTPQLDEFESELVTDADGRFALQALPLGGRGNREFYASVETESWTRAEAMLGVRSGEVGEVTLKVTRGVKVHGTARRANGGRVSHGEVLLTPAQQLLPPRPRRARADIEPDGSFQFRSAFAPGAYLLEALSPGLRTEQLGPIDLTELESEHKVEVVFSKGVRLRGVVRLVSGAPAAGVSVTARPYWLRHEPVGRVPNWPQLPDGRAVTDEVGQFVIDGLWPSNYTVAVGEVDGDGRRRFVETRVERVSPSLADNVEFVLRRLMRMEEVASQRGKPLADAELYFMAYSVHSLRGDDDFHRRIRTEADGGYHVDLPEGLWRCAWRTTTGLTSGWHDVDLVSLSGQSKRFDLALDAAHRLRIRVLDPEGAPAPGAHVRIHANGLNTNWEVAGETDATGEFTFNGLDSEDNANTWFGIRIDGDGYQGRATWTKPVIGDAEMVVKTKPSGRRMSKPQTRSVVIRGTVYAPDGTEASHVAVRGTRRQSTNSGADGRYKLTLYPGEPTVEVNAERPSIGFARQEVTVPEGETPELTVDFQLEAGTPYQGRVLDAEGNPVMFAMVAAVPADTPIPPTNSDKSRQRPGHGRLQSMARASGSYTRRANVSGFYRVTVPRGQPVRLIAWVRGYGECIGPVVAPDPARPTEPVEQDLTLDEGLSVSGRLLLANGKPAANIGTWNNGFPFFTDGEGRFSYSGFAPGEKVRFFLENLPGSPHVGMTFTAGEPPRTIRAPAAAVIRGRVLMPDESPARTFHIDFEFGVDATIRADGVRIADPGSNFGPRMLPSERFEMARLAPGGREFAIRAPGAAPVAFTNVRVSEGEIKEMEIRLLEGGEIRCLLVNAPRTLPQRVYASAVPAGAPDGFHRMFITSAEVMPEGVIVVPHVAPGRVNLGIGYGPKGLRVENVLVKNGEVTEVEVKVGE